MGAVRPTMREEPLLMIALEVDVGILVPTSAPGKPGIDSSTTTAQASHIAPPTIDGRLTDIRVAIDIP